MLHTGCQPSRGRFKAIAASGVVLQIDSRVPGGVNLRWTPTTAYALRDANRDSVRLVEQWLRIGQATSVAQVQQALGDVMAMPFVHTVAADRHGDTLMADIGLVCRSTPTVTIGAPLPAGRNADGTST